MYSRREFARISAAAFGSVVLKSFGLLPALAQNGNDYRALVCVFLFGGNDSNNTIVPLDDPSYQLYQAVRGDLALSPHSLSPPVQSDDGRPYAFHGRLSSLSSLFMNKTLAVVANVGSLVQPLTRATFQQKLAPIPPHLFSHTDQQAQWQTTPTEFVNNVVTGWGGRTADKVAELGINQTEFPVVLSVAGNALLGNGLTTHPLTIGQSGLPELTGFGNSPASQTRWNALNSILSLDSGVSLAQSANDRLAQGITYGDDLKDALSRGTALRTAFPNTSLGNQLKQIAQIIQVHNELGMRRQIFFCSIGGFDTHVSELSALDHLYPILNNALAAFFDATQELGLERQVTTFTESDFNRTFQPNTGGGSDHAWGGHHLVMGGAVSGGRVFGRFPSFQLGGSDDAYEGGHWIPSVSIDQYAATLCAWFGISDTVLPVIFPNLPNFNPGNLGFMA